MAEEAKPATPAEKTPETTPQTPAATPGAKDDGVVTIAKSEHEQLVKDAARATEAQRRADRLDRIYGGKDGSKGGHFRSETPQTPTPAPTPEELVAAGVEEDRKAVTLLTGLAIEPKYREVLDADPTLRSLFTNNPLGLLPILAPDALDAQDALELVRGKLDERLLEMKKPAQPKPEDKKPEAAPPAGGVNTSNVEKDAEVEAAKKIGNTEQAIAGMVKVGIKHMNKT